MRWFAVALVVASASALNLGKVYPCDRKECRAGRECIVSGGVAQCLCVTSCPDHDKPVCGDDDESYDNFCLLHQKACLTGNPISVDYKGYCKRDIELAMKEFGITTTKRPTTISTTTAAPVEEELSVCYGPQRDALRDTVITHWQDTVTQQPWYTKDMTYSESLSGHFFACDTDRDYKMRPDELIQCFSTMPFLPRPEQEITVTRTLCVDAILEDADSDKDWKLDFQEFTHMLDPLYHPQAKNCSLEGKDYTDGAEVRVACNHCVCATGNWVCAAHNCPEKESTSNSLGDDDFGYMDSKYDLDTDELDDDEYYDDDDYEDDDDLEELSEKKYTAEEAKKEYNTLSAVDQKKLTHLEENIKQFYEDVDRWNTSKTQSQKTTKMLNSISDEKLDDDDDDDYYDDEDDLSSEEEDILTSEEEEEEEEEDELLDQYEDLLTKSRKVRERLTALRTQINTLEDKRSTQRNQHHDHDANYYGYSHANRDHTTASPVHLNAIDHSNRRVAPATTQSRKYQKYEAYRATLDSKLRNNRVASQTDNDIWEDQWKAKIKKHHHANNHL